MVIWKRPPRDGDTGRDGGFDAVTVRSIDNFVALHVRCRSNRLERSFPIDLRLEVDELRIPVKRKRTALDKIAGLIRGDELQPSEHIELQVRIHHCYVRYRCDGVTIPADSKYRSAIEIGAYSEKQSSQDRSASTWGRGGSVDVRGALGGHLPSAAGTFTVGGANQAAYSVERTTIVSQDLYEIEAVPGGWRVGDKVHGDPRKQNNCLDGPYFARAIEGRPNTCIVQFLTGSSIGTITFQVCVRDGMRVNQASLGQLTEGNLEAVAIEAMRDRLAAICIEQSVSAEAEELVVAEVRAECVAASDTDD